MGFVSEKKEGNKMVGGNQAAADRAAQEALKKDPNNRDLQAQASRARAALNTSLANAGQKTQPAK